MGKLVPFKDKNNGLIISKQHPKNSQKVHKNTLAPENCQNGPLRGQKFDPKF